MSDAVLVIFGNRTAVEAAEAARAAMYAGKLPGRRIERLWFDPDRFTTHDRPRLEAAATRISYLAAVSDEVWRLRIHAACQAADWTSETIIHPTAVISPSATIDAGVFIGPLAVVSSEARIGAHSIVHIHASVGHDCVVGSFCSILPGARLSGNARIGDRVLIGSNAFIGAGLNVGDDCRIDALSYVGRAIPPGYLVSPRLPRPVKRPA
jgi:carbonic anhydrase/acetyltransferase-like protein (isoleucine patch superfamily)